MSASRPSAPAGNANEAPAWGRWAILFMGLTMALDGVVWLAGDRQYTLAVAVEQGAARVEQQALGEETPDVVRDKISLQRSSLRFWTVLAMIQDFGVAPLTLVLRAMFVATAFSAVAALSGRRARFPIMMADAVRWQAVWVVGLAVRVLLMLVLDRPTADTSMTVLLPIASYSATTWVLLHGIDLFAIVGWLGMAWSGWRHEQANWVVALLVCCVLAAIEVMLFAAGTLLVNLSMRLTLFPQ